MAFCLTDCCCLLAVILWLWSGRCLYVTWRAWRRAKVAVPTLAIIQLPELPEQLLQAGDAPVELSDTDLEEVEPPPVEIRSRLPVAQKVLQRMTSERFEREAPPSTVFADNNPDGLPIHVLPEDKEQTDYLGPQPRLPHK